MCIRISLNASRAYISDVSPRLQTAMNSVGNIWFELTVLEMTSPNDPRIPRLRATLARRIAERDNIALDESTLTPECIGQLMGGN